MPRNQVFYGEKMDDSPNGQPLESKTRKKTFGPYHQRETLLRVQGLGLMMETKLSHLKTQALMNL